MTTRIPIPAECGLVTDLAPINQGARSGWVVLSSDGRLSRFIASTGECELLASTTVPVEHNAEPFCEHTLRRRVHASPDGEFAAVVNDYGRYGEVLHLKSGKITLCLDGGDYCPETVPFSFAFATWRERTVAIHRTAWNRLDISDALTGHLLTSRGPTTYTHGEARPQHYLDYFHGALYLSPMGTRILDDGWVWHPVGVPAVWSMERWLSENCWEPEDGESRKEVCARESYWDHAIVWLDETRVAIGGIGDKDTEMIDGVRIFDVTSTGPAGRLWRSDWLWAQELIAFAGPSGRFFSDGKYLYSSDPSGLSIWNYKTGARVDHIADFRPTHHHLGSKELVEVAGGMLLRWSTVAQGT